MKKLLLAALLLCGGTAYAQTSEFVQTIPEYYLPKDVNFSLGAVTVYVPRYMGSDEHRAIVYPLFDAQWKNGVFFSSVNGLGYNFSKNPGLQYGLRMSVEAARDAGQSARLNGVGDVDTALEMGGFLNYSFTPNYSLLSSIRYGSGVDRNGLQISFGARATTALNESHRLTTTLRANWANGNYMQSYFGVNSTQSLASGYSAYAPNSGLTDIKLSASWHWTIDTNWSLTTGASLSRYSSDVTRSPFVYQRSPVSVYSAASYRF